MEKELEEQLREVLERIESNYYEIERLTALVFAKEMEAPYIEQSLEESARTAREMKDQATARAMRLLAEAEAVAAARKAQQAIIVQNMAELQRELQYYEQWSCHPAQGGHWGLEASTSQPSLPEPGGLPVVSLRTEPGATELKPLGDDYPYTIKLVAFVNARHHVSFGATPGPVHAHSWQVAIDVKVPPGPEDTVAFTGVFDTIKSVLLPYENTVLNQVYPFDRVQPTTENIAMYFYNSLQDELSVQGLCLDKLTLWETPTRGIEVDSRCVEFDTLTTGEEVVGEPAPARREAAAVAEAAPFVPVEGEGDPEVPASSAVAGQEIRRRYSFKEYAIGIAIILFAALLAYHSILSPPVEQRYPWGSDTWGHLFKAEYLYEQIQTGNYYPQFTEYWYNGTQPFRYWAPLPYYVLAGLRAASGDIFMAGSWYIFLCALLGGLGWLLFARRMGLWPAVMAGVLWCVWLDNVRVAFSEGNLPRVLATALLPLLVVAFLHVLENKRAYAGIVVTAVLIHLVVLCHAMLGAVYCLCLTLFVLVLWICRGCQLQDCVRGFLVLLGGVATSAWWLLPSLTGGITGLDAEAVKAAIQFVPASISLDPWQRFSNRETFYWGASIMVALAVAFAGWRSKPPWAKSLTVCSLILIILTFPVIRPFYLLLPLAHLLWPWRFTSFAILGLLAGSFAFNPPDRRQRWFGSARVTGLTVGGLFVILLLDCFFSLQLLAHTSFRSSNVLQSAQLLKDTPGWRVATIDLSQLGSAPSYTFSETAGMEQVFGWAWQGAVTSSNLMLLNTGLETQYYPFLFRSCVKLGATELVVKDDVITKPQAFGQAARQAGYHQQHSVGDISIWHSVDTPYLIKKNPRCLAIGRYAGTVALQFPEVEMGSATELDKYSVQYLKQYPMVILSGAGWWSKQQAEETITEYVKSGGQVLIELAGMPDNVLAKQPEFLGVYGEPVTPRGAFEVFGQGKRYLLQPFSPEAPVWKSYVPMGLDHIEMAFTYYGNEAPVYGYKLVGDNKVWFLGGGLLYHTFETGDRVASELLQSILGLESDYTPDELVPLQTYQATERGYEMSYESESAFKAIIPVAAVDGARVEIDAMPRTAGAFENLIQLDLPAGKHTITISLTPTPIYRWGLALSIASVLLVLMGLVVLKRTGDSKQ